MANGIGGAGSPPAADIPDPRIGNAKIIPRPARGPAPAGGPAPESSPANRGPAPPGGPAPEAAPSSDTLIQGDFDSISKTIKDPKTGKTLFDTITESMFMEFKKSSDDRAKRAKEQRKRDEGNAK